MIHNCPYCNAEVEVIRSSFRLQCEQCNRDLHTCKNCKFYQPGKPNDCLIPGTEYVADREKNNYCESFSFSGKKLTKTKSIEEISKNLFGD